MANAACYTSLKALNDAQVVRAKAFNYSTVVTYVLCPNTVFAAPRPIYPDDDEFYTAEFFNFQFDNGLVVDGNSRYLCGDDGKSSNNCTIKESPQIVSYLFNYDRTSKDNILVSGLTIDGSNSNGPAILIVAPGTITFKDCIVKVCAVVWPIINISFPP
jgi:hypothetical protein